MFGLHNFRGSCWVNTAIQAVLRIPEVQQRYDSPDFEKVNVIDECLHKIWTTKGTQGLKDFFEVVRTDTMPAGHGIGDAHELFQYLCDKLPFLDTLMRFKIADSITCMNCNIKEIKEDTVIEFSLSSDSRNKPMTECISETVAETVIDEWKCEKCEKKGCKKQQLIGSFPKVMMFHMIPTEGSIDYSSILCLNKKQYALISVSCFNGGHWWGYGRNMPPGSSWFTLNDKQVQEHGPKQFPISNRMRLLIYYRLED
jgi:ubiquitin C-terminal hydrolase